jgi:hypothetical protein
MANTDFTIEQYNALNAAIATGAKSVQYGNKMVMYNTLAEMLEARALMAASLGLIPTGGFDTSRTYGKFNKGLQ